MFLALERVITYLSLIQKVDTLIFIHFRIEMSDLYDNIYIQLFTGDEGNIWYVGPEE